MYPSVQLDGIEQDRRTDGINLHRPRGYVHWDLRKSLPQRGGQFAYAVPYGVDAW